ncbi:hypothetical protein HGM15179_002130 [Zosterops borbonicus]|uniref:Uncharacterized protein n=1 Tax=Zosterops borbonicus TaxID=364589 RepID=A0A8K1GWD8_9PASS|nr:hypothetical protein HGM15179_002130 [Zosterops borbonicus]
MSEMDKHITIQKAAQRLLVLAVDSKWSIQPQEQSIKVPEMSANSLEFHNLSLLWLGRTYFGGSVDTLVQYEQPEMELPILPYGIKCLLLPHYCEEGLARIMAQDENVHLTNRDMDTAEVFNAFSASTFNMDDGPRGSQCPEMEDPDGENEQVPFNPETEQDLLPQLDPYKSVGSDGNHSRIL